MTSLLVALIIVGVVIIGVWFIIIRDCLRHERMAAKLVARQEEQLFEEEKPLVECQRAYERQAQQLAEAELRLQQAKRHYKETYRAFESGAASVEDLKEAYAREGIAGFALFNVSVSQSPHRRRCR